MCEGGGDCPDIPNVYYCRCKKKIDDSVRVKIDLVRKDNSLGYDYPP